MKKNIKEPLLVNVFFSIWFNPSLYNVFCSFAPLPVLLNFKLSYVLEMCYF